MKKIELTIGCHLSAAKGYVHMAEEARAISANTFAFFTRNPRGGKSKAIDEKDIRMFLSMAEEDGLQQLVPAEKGAGTANEIVLRFRNFETSFGNADDSFRPRGDNEREMTLTELWEQRNNPPPVGSWVTYRHRGVHEGTGLPRFASFLRVRRDEARLRATP